MTTSDVLFACFIKCQTVKGNLTVFKEEHTMTPAISHRISDTSELDELLQKSAVEHLTTFHQLEVQKFGSVSTTDFEALYAYKHGQYQRCLHLSTHNVRTLTDWSSRSTVTTYLHVSRVYAVDG